MKLKIGDKIQCQAVHKVEANGHFGCYSCGGYGFLFEWCLCCTKCKACGWHRPDPYTTYEGKVYRTIDGLEMVSHKSGALCRKCEETSTELGGTSAYGKADNPRDTALTSSRLRLPRKRRPLLPSGPKGSR